MMNILLAEDDFTSRSMLAAITKNGVTIPLFAKTAMPLGTCCKSRKRPG